MDALDEITNSKSLFNEAGFVIRRLDILQTRINSVRMNLLYWNNEAGCYNYMILYSDLCSLLNEVWAKLTDDEKKDIEKLRSTLHKALKTIPPHKLISKEADKSNKVTLNNKSWDMIEQGLIMFEYNIKTYLDNHGLSNPNMDDEGF
jgi:hypothetical protein